VRCWQLGGDVLNEDRTQFTMHENGALDAVSQIQSLIHEQGIHTSGTALADRPLNEVFLTGKIGMFPQFSVFSGILPAEFEWDIAHMPVNADETRTTRVASAGHSIYSGTEQVDAAWAWLRMVESEEAFQHLVSTGLSVPAHIAVAESPEHLNPDQPPASKQVFLDALNYGRPEPVAGDWIAVHGEIRTALEGVYGVSQRNPEEALAEIETRVNELIAAEPSA
jgi:multiple sugar transport system substrate-binding protein